jgi:hypothetical protein
MYPWVGTIVTETNASGPATRVPIVGSIPVCRIPAVPREAPASEGA